MLREKEGEVEDFQKSLISFSERLKEIETFLGKLSKETWKIDSIKRLAELKYNAILYPYEHL